MTYQGHIVDVVRREIFDGELVVDNGRITQVNRCELPEDGRQWPYLMPGFIDSHVHIESSMMMPVEFARVAAEHGTIGVIADPHEIANVLGVEGVDVMIHSASQAQFNFLFGAPSCVPALGGNVETSGATIDILENELQRFEKGTVITFAPVSYPDDRHHATITAISPVVEKNGVIHLEAALDPHPHLMPGMSAIILLGKTE